jgi:hypothetical protein
VNGVIGKLSLELFWDVDPESIEPETHCRWILERVLERGRWEDWLLVSSHYGTERISRLAPLLRIDAKAKNFLEQYLRPYPVLEASVEKDGIRFVSVPDIAAMKVNAVTNRGSKKDFADLLLLHDTECSLRQSLDYFLRKYGSAGRFLAIRSLMWFEDAEQEPDPFFLNGWTWNEVKTRMASLARGLAKSGA